MTHPETSLDSAIEMIYSLKDYKHSSLVQVKYAVRLIQTPPNDIAIENAVGVVKEVYAFSFVPDRIFPAGGLKGGIGFIYYDDVEEPMRFGMFEMSNDGEIWVGYLSTEENYLNRLSLNAKDVLRADILKLKTFLQSN